MSSIYNNKQVSSYLQRKFKDTKSKQSEAIEKLATGTKFTSQNKSPTDKALVEGLEYRLRSIVASKRTINDAVSLLQTSESALNEINNIMTRMREINIQASSETVSNFDRKFLFLEYDALYNEIDRIAKTSEFNGIPLLDGNNPNSPKSLVFRLDSPTKNISAYDENNANINLLKFENFNTIIATNEGLGLKSAKELLSDYDTDEGIPLDEVEDFMEPEDDQFTSVYDEALTKLTHVRTTFSTMQERLSRAMDYNDVFQENITAAKSKISDIDYAKEITELTMSNVLLNAQSALMTQNNLNFQNTINLLSGVIR